MPASDDPRTPDDVAVPGPLAAWLATALGDPGPFALQRLSGGNSNETLRLTSSGGVRIVRRPPPHALAPEAHSMAREFRVLDAVGDRGVPAPRALGLCTDAAVPGAPFLVMEQVEGVPLTAEVPSEWPADPATLAHVGEAAVDALVALHAVSWEEAGLEGFGRPEGFLARQVQRWEGQYARHQVRDLPLFGPIGRWLAEHRPPEIPPTVIHGDFHTDNCLFVADPRPRVAAIIDWEMATIGDPLLDLGLLLAFWGPDRPAAPAMPHVQALSRDPAAPSREALAARYAQRSGRSVEHLPWYMTLAFWKLAAIVEGAYAQHLSGELKSDYARDLEQNVPRLLEEAAAFAGLTPATEG